MMTKSSAEKLSCWVVTDGRAGIEAQALGLAEAIAEAFPLEISMKRIAVRDPWRRLPRALWGDPLARLENPQLLAPPYPALWIGCGRLSVPFSMAMRKRSPETFVVQLQNPRAPLHHFDLVIAPNHDGLAGGNVVSIIGSTMRPRAHGAGPHDANKRDANTHDASKRDAKIVAAMIGGPNRAFDFSVADADRIAADLERLIDNGARLWLTTSRRTPEDVAGALQTRLAARAEIFWRADKDDASENPLERMLADAGAFLVTEDSVNMAVEAAATGAPLYFVALTPKPGGRSGKFSAFRESLIAHGAARPFAGALDQWRYEPLRETGRAAAEVIARLSHRHHAGVFDKPK